MLCMVCMTLKMKMENQHCFLALECQMVYYEDLASKKLLLEQGISLDKVLEKILGFYEILVEIR